MPEPVVVHDVQAEPVPASVDPLGHRVIALPSRRRAHRRPGSCHLLHLPPRGSAQRPEVVVAARWEGGGQPTHPPSQVGDARPQSTHRRTGAVAQWRRVGYALVVTHVVRPCPIVVGRPQPRRAMHAQGPQEVLGDEVLGALPRDAMDDSTQHHIPEIRVLAVRVRRPGEHRASCDHRIELLVRGIDVAICPGVVGRHSGSHRQEVAHGDRWRVGGRTHHRGELREQSRRPHRRGATDPDRGGS